MAEVEQYEIHLDRKEAVYWAGETVTGHVLLRTGRAINTRGVRLRLRGEGYCHWHRGSGDDRRDYDHCKVYEEFRTTVFGGFYTTAVLDNAGSEAVFGGASGDGQMYIPCDGKSLRLIVRVMDYDWGKKDDLLGECTVDACALAMSGQVQVFNLSRKGAPLSSTVTLSATLRPFENVFGAAAQGHESYSCLVTVHRASELRSADRFSKNDVYVQAYREPPGSNPHVHGPLPEPDKNVVLPPGTLHYPFAFQLGFAAPGSAEVGAGDMSWIRYYLYSNIDKCYWRDPSTKRGITVLPHWPAAPPQSLSPAEVLMPEFEVYGCDCKGSCEGECCELCCFCQCCGKGTAKMSVRIPKQAFAPGERFAISGEVTNRTEQEGVIEVELWKNTELKARCGSSYLSQRETKLLPDLKIQSGQTMALDAFQLTMTEGLKASPTFYGRQGGSAQASSAPDPIVDPVAWTYNLVVTFRCSGSKLESKIPILITVAPTFVTYPGIDPSTQMVVQLPPEGQKRGVYSPWVWWDVAYMANSFGAMKPLSMAAITKAGGQVMSQPDPISIASGTDDRYNVGSGMHSYQPAAISFATPTVTAIDFTQIQINPPQADVPWTGPGAGAGAPTGAPEVGVNELARSLAGKFEAVALVGEWAASNPGNASALTPADIATVLNAVTFSMEKESVARQLAASVMPMTYAHICAAMDACQFNSAEVAVAMAPFCAPQIPDPQGKQAVLANLQYDWDRAKVDAALPR